ncbi:SH3 domain-containing protein [Heliobacterium undosum]|uniref:SH3 domain-containing protein n=1 Tax=Heliomicrobium undosum TaxID=121734 RepID=A0A845L2Z8_9FIRM|nr:SH3 domain-containing protein [Heliomicrobium undosum]MZP29489.1 SH3 domain-containing protein [Heliomicrobium undosum]
MDEKGLPKTGHSGVTQEERMVLFSQPARKPRSRFRVRIAGGGLALLLSGFVLGQVVLAGAASPGTADDPLVSKSYLEKLLWGNRADLHNQIVALNQRVEALQKALEKSGQKVELPPMPQGFQNTPWNANDVDGVSAATPLVGDSQSVSNGAPVNTETAGAPAKASNPGLREGAIASPTGVNVRFGPGTDYTVITILPSGARVTILASIDGVSEAEKWYKVKMPDGREGFIRQDLVSTSR